MGCASRVLTLMLPGPKGDDNGERQENCGDGPGEHCFQAFFELTFFELIVCIRIIIAVQIVKSVEILQKV